MRLIIDIGDEVLLALEERARRDEKSVGEVISDLIRDAVQAPSRVSEASRLDSFYGFRPLPHRGGTITNELVDSLRTDD